MRFRTFFFLTLLLCCGLAAKYAAPPAAAWAAEVKQDLKAAGPAVMRQAPAEKPKIEAPDEVSLRVPLAKVIKFKLTGIKKVIVESSDERLVVLDYRDDRVIVQSIDPGQTFFLFIVGAAGDEPVMVRVKVTTEGVAPKPVPPVPPTPPVPPAPPKPPEDPLVRDIKALILAEPDALVLAKAIRLGNVYDVPPEELEKCKVGGEVIALLRTRLTPAKLEPGDLAPVRERIAKALKTCLPPKTLDPLTADHRKALAEVFALIKTALKG